MSKNVSVIYRQHGAKDKEKNTHGKLIEGYEICILKFDDNIDNIIRYELSNDFNKNLKLIAQKYCKDNGLDFSKYENVILSENNIIQIENNFKRTLLNEFNAVAEEAEKVSNRKLQDEEKGFRFAGALAGGVGGVALAGAAIMAIPTPVNLAVGGTMVIGGGVVGGAMGIGGAELINSFKHDRRLIEMKKEEINGLISSKLDLVANIGFSEAKTQEENRIKQEEQRQKNEALQKQLEEAKKQHEEKEKREAEEKERRKLDKRKKRDEFLKSHSFDEEDIRDITCPISHEIMLDPVTAPDGITYEREALVKFYNTKIQSNEQPFCPVNRDIVLTDPSKLPTTFALKKMCVKALVLWEREKNKNQNNDTSCELFRTLAEKPNSCQTLSTK